MSTIIQPGDKLWDPNFTPVIEKEVPPKLPDDVVEGAFRAVVDEVMESVKEPPVEGQIAAPVVPPAGRLKNTGYDYHNIARQKSYPIPMEQHIVATLTKDLPRSWEKRCFVGGTTWVDGVKVRKPGFRKGDKITLSSTTLYPGVGVLYGFEEGKRGGFGVRSDQVDIMPQANDDSQENMEEQGVSTGSPSPSGEGIEPTITEGRESRIDDSQVELVSK
jgi:hypothetical protein